MIKAPILVSTSSLSVYFPTRTFIKGFIAEYPKKSGVTSAQKQKTQTQKPEKKQETVQPAKDIKTNEMDKKPVSPKKNEDNSKGNQKNNKSAHYIYVCKNGRL